MHCCGDDILIVMASQVIGVPIAYSTLFRGRSKKTSNLRVTDLCEGNPPVTSEFPSQGPKCFRLMTSSWIYSPVFSRVVSIALGQTHDCPSGSEVFMENMGKTDIGTNWYVLIANKFTTKRNRVYGYIIWSIFINVYQCCGHAPFTTPM